MNEHVTVHISGVVDKGIVLLSVIRIHYNFVKNQETKFTLRNN